MHKRLAGLAAVGVLLGIGLSTRARRTDAQGNSQVMLGEELAHTLTPPLGELPALPETGPRHEIPLRHPLLPSAAQMQPDPVLQTSATAPLQPSGSANFIGVGVGITSTYSDLYAPPDTNGAAGATQFVQWVNVSFAVFDKTGNLLHGPTAGNTLWQGLAGTAGQACASNNSGDPIAQYDKQAGQWVMMQPVFTSPYAICVAVSATSDATGSWYAYAFSVPGNLFPDYPKLSVWPDAYYLSYNQFNGNSFVGAAACALDRADMLKGNFANGMQCFSTSTSYPSLLPSDLDGAVPGLASTTAPPPSGSPAYFLDFGSNSLNTWQFHVDWTNPVNSTFTGPTSLPVSAFSEACNGGACIPQPGTREKLDSLGDRLMYRLAYRNFATAGYQSMVVTHSVAVSSGGKHGSSYTALRWYELRTGTGVGGWSVYQSGTYAPTTDYRWMGSIAEDKLGDLALGYSLSNSSSIFPSIAMTGRVPTDSLGSMESEGLVWGGKGSQLPNLNRWGDYSSMAVDPSDDCTFWYTTEYLQNSGTFNWSTRIASFKFPGCN